MGTVFQKNVKLYINNNNNDVINYAKNNNKQNMYDISFNSETVANKNTKLVIVGTYTPKKGRLKGYYYTSDERNKTYQILQDYFKIELVKRKQFLNAHPMHQKTISEIKELLISKNIAFIDVVGSAISPDNNASNDKIEFFSLDKDAFKNLDPNVVYICNSKDSEEAFKIMFPNKKYRFAQQEQFCKSYDYIYKIWETVLDDYYDRTSNKWR